MRSWVAFLIALLCVGGALAQDDADDDLIAVPAVIETADLTFNAAGGYTLTMRGYMGTGCDFPAEVVQTVSGATLEIDVFQRVPADIMCPMVIVPYDDAVTLDPPAGVLRVAVGDETFDLPGAQAVPATPEAKSSRVESLVDDVTFNDDGEIVISGAHPDGCEVDVTAEVIALDDAWSLVWIYRIIPDDLVCTRNLQPFEMTFTAAELTFPEPLDAVESLILEANEAVFVYDGDEWQEAERDFLTVERREIITARGLSLSVEGTFSDGCEFPTTARATQRYEQDVFDVWVYRVVVPDDERLCLAVLQTVEQVVSLPPDLPTGLYRYNINQGESTGAFVAEALTVEDQLRSRVNRVPHVVEEMSVSADDDGAIIASITGYLPDGCGAEALVDIAPAGNVIRVEVYREIPPGVACPMVIVPFAEEIALGAFDSGDYTVTVNGVTRVVTVP